MWKKGKNIVLNAAFELYSDLLVIYLEKYYKLSANKKKKFSAEDSFDNLALDDYDYLVWFEKKNQTM